MSGYGELDTLVAAVEGLQRRRSAVAVCRAAGLTDEELAGPRRASRSALISVEKAAVDLATCSRLRGRVEEAAAGPERGPGGGPR